MRGVPIAVENLRKNCLTVRREQSFILHNNWPAFHCSNMCLKFYIHERILNKGKIKLHKYEGEHTWRTTTRQLVVWHVLVISICIILCYCLKKSLPLKLFFGTCEWVKINIKGFSFWFSNRAKLHSFLCGCSPNLGKSALKR